VAEMQYRQTPSRVPMLATMEKIPAGLMLVPLLLGALVNTFAPEVLEIGSFTTALFKQGALTLIALLIFATGAEITGRHSGKAAASTTLVVLTCKTLIPAALAVTLGLVVGIEGIFGVSVLALLTIFGNSNGALWLAFAGEYGDERDTGAYVASAFDDGPFLALIFLGAAGLGDIPLLALVAALVPFLLGLFVGAVDREWTRVLEHVPTITIPFMSFAVGTGINLGTVVTGGLTGVFLGLWVVGFTGGLTYLGYRFVLRRGPKSGIGFAAGTTAGNAVATPAVVAAADPRFAPFVASAASQAATAVLVTALLAPLVASFVLKRAGGLELTQVEDVTHAEEATRPEGPTRPEGMT
jgi:2-keto-3-deoxygluconate permease